MPYVQRTTHSNGDIVESNVAELTFHFCTVMNTSKIPLIVVVWSQESIISKPSQFKFKLFDACLDVT